MYVRLKRILDFTLALIGIIVLSPLFLIIMLAIKTDSRGAVFFKQKRIGLNKEPFYIFKFRTMREDAPKDCPTHMLENPDSYITRVGRFLRKTSLDELPQLINIIKGDMSIIGPRPALWNQYDLIEMRDACGANGIRPGLTGLAQISGRDELDIGIKARMDGEYVKKMSFWLDVKIFFKTVLIVLKGEGVREGKQREKELAG